MIETTKKVVMRPWYSQPSKKWILPVKTCPRCNEGKYRRSNEL